MRAKLTGVLIILVLITGVTSGSLVLGGCDAVTIPDTREVPEMKAMEIPVIDLAQPDTFQTATFALG